jgi:hypothetical protein
MAKALSRSRAISGQEIQHHSGRSEAELLRDDAVIPRESNQR